MKYNDTTIDKNLRKWFTNDYSRSLLRGIFLTEGKLRGVTSFELEIDFPILAIAGKNGAGKSTLLAMACCAYHNEEDGFKLPRRRIPYYTFRDFFIQHKGEVLPDGISIDYFFAVDTLEMDAEHPQGEGIGYQTRRKAQGGKWNDYDVRLYKPVIFLGIERIVPHSERSQSRSYRRVFASQKTKQWEPRVREIVGRILDKPYKDFKLLEHSKYSLPLVRVDDSVYSGFNMGAGESALFEIFSAIYSCPESSLVVLDEIELGLHSVAQKRFIEELKKTCLEAKTQVICTTHSKEIFDSLPGDARVFIEQVNGKTRISRGVSSEFAMTKMGARIDRELLIFVEDDVALAVVSAALPASLRSRVRIVPIGSASAMARQLAAAYVRKETRPVIAIYDGDQASKADDNLKHARSMAENTKADFGEWVTQRSAYLPGDSWPEAWLVQKAMLVPAAVAASVGADEDEMCDFLKYGLQAGKHEEFFEIARQVGLGRSQCIDAIVPVVCSSFPDEFDMIRALIRAKLDT